LGFGVRVRGTCSSMARFWSVASAMARPMARPRAAALGSLAAWLGVRVRVRVRVRGRGRG
jgi:hypothetical protein